MTSGHLVNTWQYLAVDTTVACYLTGHLWPAGRRRCRETDSSDAVNPAIVNTAMRVKLRGAVFHKNNLIECMKYCIVIK